MISKAGAMMYKKSGVKSDSLDADTAEQGEVSVGLHSKDIVLRRYKRAKLLIKRVNPTPWNQIGIWTW